MPEEPLSNVADDTPSPAEPAPEVSELDALRRERDENYDRFVRKAAEFDNYRKRVERERREQADRAVVGMLEELVAVVDDFDRALTVDSGEGGAAYRKGVEMIHAKLHDLLRKQGVKAIDALGTDFDPNLHEAVLQESSPGHRENEVIAVLRQGYTLNDRLLRPASVKVAKA
ncbi:MAG TPA: nucleotide exchange factor GrpE [Vicinamibacterales bacterium]|nr:nucleotide exchange factor GrpE [Vicinamibacterales bacterium]